MRVENVEHPAQYIEAVLRRTQTKHIERTYDIKQAEYDDDPIEFLSILARKAGRLLKGGEPDVDGVAKMVLNDFLRGKIPWFTRPPKKEGAPAEEAEDGGNAEVVEGRKGALGEMPGDRKDDVPAAAVLEDAVLEQEVFAGLSDEDDYDESDENVENEDDEGAEPVSGGSRDDESESAAVAGGVEVA